MGKKKSRGKKDANEGFPDASPQGETALEAEDPLLELGGKKKGIKARGAEAPSDSVVDASEVVVSESKEKKKKKGKKAKKLEDAFRELGSDDDDDDDFVNGGNERRGTEQKQQEASGFAALVEENDEASGRDDESVEEEEQAVPMVKTKGKKKGKGGGRNVLNVFDALEMEEEGMSDDDEPAVPEIEAKSKKQKGKGARDMSSAFAALEIDDNEEEEEEEEKEEHADEKPGSGFAALAMDDDDDDDEGEGEDEDEDEETSMSVESPVPEETGKGKKKKKIMVTDDAFAALAEEDEADVVENGDGIDLGGDVASKSAKKKKKKDRVLSSAFDVLAEEATAHESVTDQAKSKKEKKKKKKGTSSLDDAFAALDDEDGHEEKPSSSQPQASSAFALLAEENNDEVEQEVVASVSAPKVPPVEPAETKASKKKKKKGKGAAQQSMEDIDALLAEIEGTAPPKADPKQSAAAASSSAPADDPKNPTTDSTAAAAAEAAHPVADEKPPSNEEGSAVQEDPPGGEQDNEGDDGEAKALTAAQKKKLRKKAKKAKDAEKTQEAESAKESKKLPAHVRKMQEALEKRRVEEERLEREEQERLRVEEEERLREEEAQRLKEEEKERKRLEREEMRKAGVPMSKKALEEQQKREQMRARLLENAAAQGIALPGASDSGGQKPKRVSEVKSVNRRQQRQREQQRAAEEKKRAEEERIRKQEEERKAKEEALRIEKERKETEEKKAEEDGIDDWENAADNWEELSADEGKQDAGKSQGGDEEEGESEDGKAKALSEDEEASELESESESETESESESEEESSSEYTTDSEEVRERRLEAMKQKMEEKIEEAKASANADNLRSPICCILGHVDTGKTKILDNVRRTNVQDNEAGGITQQIGATYIPKEAILSRTETMRQGRDYNLKVPGLLVIDTPGHESFTNLRSRGSSLCDIAILVVDLMHGLEPQTIESMNLLKQRKTPFIVALNKVDRLLDWKTIENNPIRMSLQQQKKHTKGEFEDRLKMCTTQLMEQGMNVALYWKNSDPRKIVSMIPTSAITGEGIPDLLQLLVKLTTSMMSEKLMFLGNVLQCTVLEVKALEGLGTTIDVVLVNGELKEGDKIVVCGMSGPIVTAVRSLLTPHPLKELRVKGSYLHHKSIQAAQGVKLCAQGLEQAVAGTAMYVVKDEDEEEDYRMLAMEEMESVMSRIDRSGEGVCVQASTLGSLEALLDFLKTPEVSIPVSAINIGPVHKRDIMRANVMIEKKMKKFGVILAFDVPVTREARDLAEEMGVKVFTADIIYHLFDQFKNYMDEVRRAEKTAAREEAVFPCLLKIIPTCIFNAKDPIVLGVEVVDGQLRIGTPLCVPGKQVSLGRIESLELNHKAVEEAHRGDSVAVKIRATSPEEAAKLYGRHFDHTDELVSKITRESIDSLKAFFKDEMAKDDWKLVIKLKQIFQIQ